MKTSLLSRRVFFCATLVLLVAHQSVSIAGRPSVRPIVPRENEQIVRDQLIILVDESGSVGSSDVFDYQKSLVQAFTSVMPNGSYLSGIDSFGGVSRIEWLNEPLAPFSSDTMVEGASSLEPLGSLTPLARAILSQVPELSGRGGRGALLVFSDGRVRDPDEVLDACRELKAAHGGELCVFTVQAGSSARGKTLLQQMAAVNGCGEYYDGASLASTGSMESLVRDIFFGAAVVPRPAAVLKPAEGVSLALTNVYFDTDSWVVDSKYDSQLAEVSSMLKRNPEMRIRLEGHTDSSASNQYNQTLSERRVDAVKAALVTHGADASRLVTSAYGEARPVISTGGPVTMGMNRRVELSIIK